MEIGTMGKIVNAINSYIYGFLLSSQCHEQLHWPFDMKKLSFSRFQVVAVVIETSVMLRVFMLKLCHTSLCHHITHLTALPSPFNIELLTVTMLMLAAHHQYCRRDENCKIFLKNKVYVHFSAS